MGGQPEDQNLNHPPEHPPPKVVPVIQALGLVLVAGLAALDVFSPEADVPLPVYGVIVAIVAGIGPDSLKSIIRGGS